MFVALLLTLSACDNAGVSQLQLDPASEPIDVTLGTLFVGTGDATLFDSEGNEVATASADSTTDGRLEFPKLTPGSYYLAMTDDGGNPAYNDAGQLAFAPMVVDGDAKLVEGPFSLDGVGEGLFILDVGDVADSKAFSMTTGSTTARLRVTWEASYAMGGDFSKGCNSATSCWNYSTASAYASGDYASDDTSAWSTMRTRYGTGGNVSCKDGGSAVCYIGTGSATASTYTYQATTDSTTKRYRGGQCKFFNNLVLYRSGQYTKTLPSDATISASTATYPVATTTSIAVGDVLRRPSGHSALVVAYDSSTQKALVVDSNYLSGDGHEAIGAHTLSYSSGSTSVAYWSSYRDLDCVYSSTPCGT